MLQTILIPRAKFSLRTAIIWLDNHNYVHPKYDITNNYYRFRQRPPCQKESARYFSYSLPNGVILSFCTED